MTDSFAEDIGLMDKDVILSINRQPVTSVEDFKKIQGTLKSGDAVAFHIMRPVGGRPRPCAAMDHVVCVGRVAQGLGYSS